MPANDNPPPEATDDTQLVEGPPTEEPEPVEPTPVEAGLELEAANDNQPRPSRHQHDRSALRTAAVRDMETRLSMNRCVNREKMQRL